jgi:diacylglycerol O-acyltransferase
VGDAVLDRLSPEDAKILALERGAVAGHTAKIVVLSEARTVEEIRARVAEGLPCAPRLKRRLVPTPLGLAPPVWADDPDFDLVRHVVGAPAPDPLPRDALPDLVGRLMAGRLDRAHPLWRMDVAPLSEPEGTAIIWRLHHAMADGSMSVRLAKDLLWDGDEDPADALAALVTGPPPSARRMLLEGARWRGQATRDNARELRRAIARARARHREAGGEPSELRTVLRRELRSASRPTPLAVKAGSRRAVAWFGTELGLLHDAAKQAGATVNDAVLTVVAGGLSQWLADHGVEPGEVRAKVPVSLHHAGDGVANRDSFMFVDLDLEDTDPHTRLRRISAETKECKQHHDAEVLDAFLHGLGEVSHTAEKLAERWARSPRVFALNVSNVPGPPGPLTVAGAPVESMISLAEIAQRHALRVSVISSGGRLGFGLCADADAVGDVATLADEMEAVARTLTAAA